MPPKCGILQGPHPSSNISPAWKREETYVREPSYGGATSHVHAAGVHHYGWHGTWMSNLSQATSGTPVSQERRVLLDYDVLDRTRISFAFLWTSLLCLRGSRSIRRVNLNLKRWTLISKEDFSFWRMLRYKFRFDSFFSEALYTGLFYQHSLHID